MGNLFMDAAGILTQNNQLNYIDYQKINDNQSEFLLNTQWDFSFTMTPRAVYYPGDEWMHTRLREVNPTIPNDLTEVSATIRGFRISQAVKSGSTNGSIELAFTDREDQSIAAWFDDWKEKISSRKNNYSFRKEDTIAHAVLTLLNNTRQPIRKYKLLTLQPQAAPIHPTNLGSDDPAQMGDYSITLNYEHHELIWINMPK